ncbi:MAG: phytanoyl-CoA dioxygenase family protein [Gemmataceae bacterium]
MLILDEINDGPGFCLEALTTQELEFIRGRITAQYLDRLGQLQPDLVPLARDRGIARYHTLPVNFDHGKSWPKSTRLLDAKHVADFSRMGFFKRIQSQIGPSAVISHDELNWRLVRPNQPTDIGPLHADKWFWDAGYGYGSMPAGFDRFKIWMAIHTEPGANGLCVKPGSHRQEWKHHFEEKDGVRKPVFDEDPDAIGTELLPLGAGQMVMFHDELLHGGVVNRGQTCRVSIELTVLFDRNDALARVARLRDQLHAVA